MDKTWNIARKIIKNKKRNRQWTKPGTLLKKDKEHCTKHKETGK